MHFDSFPHLLMSVFSFEPLAYTTLGVFVGLVTGAIPGVSGTLALALLLPVSMFLDPLTSLGLLMGAYKGAVFGGDITAIAFGTPGTPDAVVATFDGYPRTKQGYPKKAMDTALYTSVLSDISSDIILILVSAPLAAMAIAFGPRELLGLTFMAIVVVVIFVQESPVQGAISAAIGAFLGSVGTDPMIAISERFTFGIPLLLGGIQLVPFVIGLVGMCMLWEQIGTYVSQRAARAAGHANPLRTTIERRPDDKLTIKEWLKFRREFFIGLATGTILGAIPGPGATMAAYTSYGIAKRVSVDRENFGKGSLYGLTAAEAANSATCGATFIPLFAFGIPGSVMAALFAAGMMLQGITPGPTTFVTHTELIYAFFILLIIANGINLIVSKALIPVAVVFTRTPPAILLPILIVFCLMGSYAYTNSYVGVVTAVSGATLGALLSRWSIPNAPLVIAFLVVPLMEQSLRRAAIIADGSVLYFFSSPLAVAFYCITVIVLWLVVRRSPSAPKPVAKTDVDA